MSTKMPLKIEESLESYKDFDALLHSIIKSLDLSPSEDKAEKHCASSSLFANKLLITKLIKKGLPFKAFIEIQERAPFTEDDWAHYLDISQKTLYRIKKNEDHVFKAVHTEKILELVEVTHLGLDVFGSMENFYTWLNATSIALGNMKPSELLSDSYGKELVMAELNRIDQGIFA